MAKKSRLCRYCKGTISFTNDSGFTQWGIRCNLSGLPHFRNFDTEGQAQHSIDEWCTGDGRRACRPYLLRETGHNYNFGGDLLREFEAMEEATVAKQKYYCKCGKTFEKSSTAQDTGYRMDDYGPEHECYGCPFVEDVIDGWGDTLTVKTHECRASADKVKYTTTAHMALDSDCVARVYTLDLPWLDQFINFYLDTPGHDRSIVDRDPDKLEKAFRNSSLLNGRRSYSFEFKKNKQGRAARRIVYDKFFSEDGKAYQLGCGPPDEKVRILQMIEYAKQAAREDTVQTEDEIFAADSDVAEEDDGMAKLDVPRQPLEAASATSRNITDVTAEIRFYKAQTVSNIIEIGKRLIEAKAMLEHGQWGEWLENSVELSHRTANNFMSIAQEYSNSQPVANLNYTSLLALLTLPSDERDDFIEATHTVDGVDKTVDEMSKRELQRVIKERDEALRAAEEQRQRASLQENLALEDRRKLGDQTEKVRQLKDENRRQRLDIDRLESKPIDVAVQQPSNAQMNVMRENIRHEVMQSLALPDTYFAKKGTEESVSIFMDAIGGAAANGIIALMRMDGKTAAKTLRVYISTLERFASELNDRLKLMLQVDRSAKEGTDDVDW